MYWDHYYTNFYFDTFFEWKKHSWMLQLLVIFLDSTKLKIVWTKTTTFFKQHVSIILWSFFLFVQNNSMFDQNITSVTETVWFFLVSTMWKWQKVKNYWKKQYKKFCGFYSIRRHPRKSVVQSSPNTYFQKRWFLLANTTWKWQKVKTFWNKRKKNFRGFFSI